MDFWQTLLSTFFGALLAFIFSIILFYITQEVSSANKKSKLEKYLFYEFEYNQNYLKKVLEDLQKCIEKITVNDKQLFAVFNFAQYQRLFINQYFQHGHLYEKLSPDDIKQIDAMLNHFTPNGENWLLNSIDRWKKDELSPKDMLNIISFEREQVALYLKFVEGIKNKIQYTK